MLKADRSVFGECHISEDNGGYILYFTCENITFKINTFCN